MDAADVHGQDFVAGSALELVCPAGQHSECSQAAEGHTGPADSPGGKEGVPRTGPQLHAALHGTDENPVPAGHQPVEDHLRGGGEQPGRPDHRMEAVLLLLVGKHIKNDSD